MPQTTLQDYTFAFQPILDRNHAVVGHELLYREHLELSAAPEKDPVRMSASVIINAFIHSDDNYGHCQNMMFFNISEDLLLSEMVQFLPKKKVVLELLESITPTERVLERCRELKKLNYLIALDDFTSITPDLANLLEIADIVKIDIRAVPSQHLAELTRQLRAWPVKLLAEKVETEEELALCQNLGFELFQGYYFARPKFVSGRRPDPGKLTVLNLLSQLMCDVDDRIVEEVFRENPGLVYHLLRLVNTAAFGLSTKVGSIRQALNLIGRNTLIRWIQMLLFSLDDDTAFPSALLQLASRRAKFMELLARHDSHQLGIFQEHSYMTGMLSLADTLLGMPMEEIVRILNPEDSVRDALLFRNGRIGQLLQLCEHLEAGELDTAEQLADTMHITQQAVLESLGDAMVWTCKLTG